MSLEGKIDHPLPYRGSEISPFDKEMTVEIPHEARGWGGHRYTGTEDSAVHHVHDAVMECDSLTFVPVQAPLSLHS